MTDATALAKQIIHEVNLGECWEDQEHLGEIAIVERILTLALAQAQRETWEQAAVIVEQDCYGDIASLLGLTDEQAKHNLNQQALAAKIRQQAQEAP